MVLNCVGADEPVPVEVWNVMLTSKLELAPGNEPISSLKNLRKSMHNAFFMPYPSLLSCVQGLPSKSTNTVIPAIYWLFIVICREPY